MSAIIDSVARTLGVSKDRAATLVGELIEQVRSETAGGDSVRLPGLGIFRVVGGTLLFEPESRLSAVVNHRFAGLSTIPVDALGTPAARRSEGFAATEVPVADHEEEDESVAEYESDVSAWPGSHVGIPVAPGAFDELGLEEPAEPMPSVAEETDETAEFSSALDTELVDADDEAGFEEEAVPGEPAHEVPVSDPWFAGDDRERFSSYDEGQDWSDDTGAALVPEDDVLFGSVTSADLGESRIEEIDRAEPEELAEVKPEAETEQPESVAEAVEGLAEAEAAAPAGAEAAPTTPKVVKVKSRRSGIYAVVIVTLLIAIAGVLYLLSRGERSQTGGEAAGPETQPEETVEAAPPEAAAAETPPPTEWSPGAIDRRTDGYTIITSSHASLGEAEVYARELARAFADTDLPVDILRGTAQGKRWYRVAIGQYPRQSVVTRELRRLSDKLPEGSWVLRIRSNM